MCPGPEHLQDGCQGVDDPTRGYAVGRLHNLEDAHREVPVLVSEDGQQQHALHGTLRSLPAAEVHRLAAPLHIREELRLHRHRHLSGARHSVHSHPGRTRYSKTWWSTSDLPTAIGLWSRTPTLTPNFASMLLCDL